MKKLSKLSPEDELIELMNEAKSKDADISIKDAYKYAINKKEEEDYTGGLLDLIESLWEAEAKRFIAEIGHRGGLISLFKFLEETKEARRNLMEKICAINR